MGMTKIVCLSAYFQKGKKGLTSLQYLNVRSYKILIYLLLLTNLLLPPAILILHHTDEFTQCAT